MQIPQAQLFYTPHSQICTQPVHMYLVSSWIELFQAEKAEKAKTAGIRKMQEGVPLMSSHEYRGWGMSPEIIFE